MSDTEAKIAQRREEALKNKKRNQRRDASNIDHNRVKKNLTTAALVLVLVLALAFILGNLGISKRVVTAAKVGEERISSAELGYYYNEAFNNYYSNLYYYYYYGLIDSIPIDTTRSLKKQVYDEETGQSLSDYFKEVALENIHQVYALCAEAEKNGFTMNEEDQKSYEDALASVKTTANQYGYTSLNQYLLHTYGLGFNKDLLEKCVHMQYLASSYAQSIEDGYEYSIDDLTKYYEENRKDFDILSIRYQLFAPEKSEELTAEALLAAAKAKADDFMAGVTTEEEYSAKALTLAKANAEDPEKITSETTLHANTDYSTLSYYSTKLADWAVEEGRKAGDMAVIDAGGNLGYLAVYMVTPSHLDTYNTVDVRHILIQPEATEKDDTEAAEAALAAAKAKAEEILNEYLAGAATEESFGLLAIANSKDSNAAEGGLYEGVYKGQMVAEFNDWCFDEARQPGDTGIVETSYGYHVMYYVGENAPYWHTLVREAEVRADYTEYIEGIEAQYSVKSYAFGKWFVNEPIK